ncbi:hypothetical protein [Maritalea sp.]|uniref:hypothetical protein n=1 Tax=Maritalea sp. TaxID=2003361 RepID=UPI003EFA63E9
MTNSNLKTKTAHAQTLQNWMDAAKLNPGFKLLTIMELDFDAGLARRSFSSNQTVYPSGGKMPGEYKPMIQNQWYQDVVVDQRPYLANRTSEMGDQFPDLSVIESLGCGSIVNVPVVKDGKTVSVINILHEEGYFTPKRYEAACALAQTLLDTDIS